MRARSGALARIALWVPVLVGLTLGWSPLGAAQADRPINELTLQGVPPGFTALSAEEGGEQEIDLETFEQFTPGSADEMEEVFVAGFQRTWVKQDTGSVVSSMALEFDETVDKSEFLRGIEASTDDGGSTFVATGIPDAVGVSTTQDVGGGQQLSFHGVLFLKQRHAFFDLIGSFQASHTPEEAIALATTHRTEVAFLPPAEEVSGFNTTVLIFSIIFLVVVLGGLVLLLVTLIRRRKRSSSGVPMVQPAVVATAAPDTGAGVGGAGGANAGWHPDPYGRHELRWFDGERWTDSVNDAGTTSQDAEGSGPSV